MTGAVSAPDGVQLLAQADLLLGLARCFSRPTAKAISALEELAAAADDLTRAAQVAEPSALVAALSGAAVGARAAGVEAWAAEHERLFSCGVVCPIHETGFVCRDKGHILADLAGFYLAFGVGLRPEVHERQDHLVAELEFLASLLVRLSAARAGRRAEAAEVTGAALRAFASDHLGDWLPGFAAHLRGSCALDVYTRLADALAHTWAALVAAHGLDEPGRRLPMVEPGVEPGTPYECGMDEAGLA